MDAPTENGPGGLLYYLYQGTNLGIYPPMIFLCLGASTDFGPLLANPKTILLGGAAQFGIFRRILPFSNVGDDTARSCFSRDYPGVRMTNSLVLNDKTCTALITSNRPSSVLIHGACANYSTANYSCAHNEERTSCEDDRKP